MTLVGCGFDALGQTKDRWTLSVQGGFGGRSRSLKGP